MNTSTLKAYLFIIGLSSTQLLFAQTTSNSTSASSDYQARQQKIEAVYGNSFFANKTSLLRQFHLLLSDRIEYKEAPASSNEKYPKLSSMPLSNKHQPVLAERGFDPATFNPLVYKLPFFAKQTHIYRIDDSDFLLIIHPQ